MADITVSNLEKTYILEPVLRDVSFLINPGEKVAIVGANGSGKTTLLRIIAGVLNHDKGSIRIDTGRRLAFLRQIPEYPVETKAMDVFQSGAKELIEAGRMLEKLQKELEEDNSEEYADLFSKWENLGGYTLESRMNRIAEGLHVDNILDRPHNALSGGEKTRIELGRILLSNPDILILDEPTNHLDIPAREWLEDFIVNSIITTVIVSHDRYFLDKVAERIIEIRHGDGAELYYGDYSYFLREKKRRYDEAMKHYQLAQRESARMEEAIARMRLWAGNADNEKMFQRAKSMEKRLEKMDQPEAPTEERNMRSLGIRSSGRTVRDVLRAYRLAMSYGEQILFEELSFDINGGDRIALIGPNGTGKTTLIDIITGRSRRRDGELHYGKGVEIGHLEQEIDFPNPEQSLYDIFRDRFPNEESIIRTKLAKFLFFGEDVFREVGSLSGGEKVRFRLAMLMEEDINFLILDEPTNHLDIPAQRLFEEALLNFDGTVLFVSHDRWFINSVANRIFYLDDGRLRVFNGDYEYFLSRHKVEPEEICSPKKSKPRPDRKVERAIKKLEKKIEQKEIRLSEITAEMEKSGDNFGKLMALQRDKDTLEVELDELLIELLQLEKD